MTPYYTLCIVWSYGYFVYVLGHNRLWILDMDMAPSWSHFLTLHLHSL